VYTIRESKSKRILDLPFAKLLNIEADLPGELARLEHLLPEHLLDRRVEIELIAEAAA
jgi:hypothetical protein